MSTEQLEVRGVCHFHSETGTEGGYWAFQDKDHIHREVKKGYCRKCGKNMQEIPEDAMMYVAKVNVITDEMWKEFQETGKFPETTECASGECVEEIGMIFSYDGLHILEDGDDLTVLSKDSDEVLWSGKVFLKNFDVFTETAFGMWIHSEQVGVDRERWAKYFIEEHPAVLVKRM